MPTNASVLAEFALQPPTDPLRIVAAGVVLAVLGAVVYWRTATLARWKRWTLGVFRVTAITALVIILLGPSMLRWISEQNFRRKLVIAMDTSCSFGVKDADDGTAKPASRFEAARKAWLDPGLIGRLRDRYDLRFYRYDEHVAATGPGALWDLPEPAGRQTYIASAVNRLLEAEFDQTAEPAGLLLIGDGRETGPGDPGVVGEAAKQRGVPIFTSCFGTRRDERDLAVQTYTGQEFLFVKQTGQVAAKIVQSGFGLEEPTVTLRREGKPVQQRRVAFGNRAAADVTFDIREETPGLVEYEVRVEPLSEETETTNNARSVFVQVTNEKIKVLLAEGQPYWDTKFLARSLRADPQVELTQVIRYGKARFHAIRTGRKDTPQAPARGEEVVPVPRTREALFAYDVLIFGKGLPDVLGVERIGLLKEFLDQRGGGIVFARGRPYDPSTGNGRAAAKALASLEPITWGDEYLRELRLELTADGRSHPSFQFGGDRPADVLLHELPGMIGAVRIRKEKAAALVLARSRPRSGAPAGGDLPMAALAYQNYGRGRVVSVLSEGLWQWAFLPDDDAKLASLKPFDLFWRRMLQWLAGASDFLPGQDVALKIARFPEHLGDSARIEVRTKLPPRADTPATLEITGPDGRTQPLALTRPEQSGGTFWAAFDPTQPGVYRVRLQTPEMTPKEQETRFCVYDYSTELLQTSADPVAMRDMAVASGGEPIDPADPQRLFSLLEERHPRNRAEREMDFVWDRPSVFAAIVAVLAIEWFLRRRGGVA